jgi:hypothetical protein
MTALFAARYWLDSPRWFALAALSAILTVGLGILAAWRTANVLMWADEPRTLTRERFLNLALGYQALPEKLPPGWAEPVAAPGSDDWTLRAGGLLMKASALSSPESCELIVRMQDGRREISDARAREVLSQFRGVGEFEDLRTLFARLMGGFVPRVFGATYRHSPTTLTLPRPKLEPLAPPIVEAKEHLPDPRPRGWSAPMAVRDAARGSKDGGWMFDADDITVIVTRVPPSGELLIVLIPTSLEPIDDTRAHAVLKHLRGVSDFRPADAEGTPAPARAYVGSIAPRASPGTERRPN